MKLDYTFEGVELMNGLYPRVNVLVTAREAGWGYDTACPSIRISVPIADLGAPIDSVRAQALEFAKRLLYESALEEWAKARNWPIQSVEKCVLPLDDAFVELMKGVPSGD